MAPPKKLSPEQEAEIVAALQSGESVRKLAFKHGVGESTVSRIGAAAGVDVAQAAVKRAQQAAQTWNLERRLALSDRFFEQIRAGLERNPDSTELRNLAVTYGIAVEKRRLEDGDATQRTEVSDSGARDRLAAKIAELAKRRASSGTEQQAS